MSTSYHPQFEEYLATHSGIKPEKEFEAMAGEAAVPPWPAPFPLGRVFIYPEFLAFLTTRMFSRGAAGFGEKLAHNLADHVILVEMTQSIQEGSHGLVNSK